MKNLILKDKNNKIIKEGNKVKFFMGTSPSDPFGYWESGIIKFINGIFMIIDGDSEWTAHGKILEIINFRESKDEYFLKIAKLVSTRSTCPRRSVGCVITNKYNHIKATGYNGVPSNFPHCIDKPCGGESQESSKGLSSCMATHAEQNALLQCDNVMDIETIYITTSPCITCAKLIANTSCKEVIYSEEYTDTSGIDMLKKLNIKTTHKQI